MNNLIIHLQNSNVTSMCNDRTLNSVLTNGKKPIGSCRPKWEGLRRATFWDMMNCIKQVQKIVSGSQNVNKQSDSITMRKERRSRLTCYVLGRTRVRVPARRPCLLNEGFVVVLSILRQISEHFIRINKDHFLPNRLRFIISSHHRYLCCL